MKIAERIALIMVTVAILLKLGHLPLASFLLIIGASVLSLLYFWGSFLLFGTPTQRDQVIPLTILSGVGLSIACMALIFNLQRWPMAGFYLWCSVFLLVLSVALALVIRGGRPELSLYFTTLLRRLVPALALCILLFVPQVRAVFIPTLDPLHEALLNACHQQRTAEACVDLERYQNLRAEQEHILDRLSSSPTPEERSYLNERAAQLEQELLDLAP